MRLHDYPARLRRGAAPPDEKTSFFCLGFASVAHAAILLFFVTWAKPPLEVALPGGSSGPKPPRAQLVRLSPLRTFPPAEAQPPEPEKSRPKPALVKRYTPGAPIVPIRERGAQRKSTSEETKASRTEVSPAAAADRAQRWWSPDSSSSVGVRTDGDFRWAYYLAAIRNKIGAAWVPPPGIGGRRVHASVYFRISKEGEVSVARVEDGSGNAFFDQTTMRALLAVGRMPPLPAGYNGEWLGVHFGFEYEQ